MTQFVRLLTRIKRKNDTRKSSEWDYERILIYMFSRPAAQNQHRQVQNEFQTLTHRTGE